MKEETHCSFHHNPNGYNVCVSILCLSQKKQSSRFVPHRPSVCLLMGLKPSHNIQELPTFVCYELCDIRPEFPLACVCVSVMCLSQQKGGMCDVFFSCSI